MWHHSPSKTLLLNWFLQDQQLEFIIWNQPRSHSSLNNLSIQWFFYICITDKNLMFDIKMKQARSKLYHNNEINILFHFIPHNSRPSTRMPMSRASVPVFGNLSFRASSSPIANDFIDLADHLQSPLLHIAQPHESQFI